MSEQLSDRSSSLALPDDLSLDEHSSYQLLARDSQVQRRYYTLHSEQYTLLMVLRFHIRPLKTRKNIVNTQKSRFVKNQCHRLS